VATGYLGGGMVWEGRPIHSEMARDLATGARAPFRRLGFQLSRHGDGDGFRERDLAHRKRRGVRSRVCPHGPRPGTGEWSGATGPRPRGLYKFPARRWANSADPVKFPRPAAAPAAWRCWVASGVTEGRPDSCAGCVRDLIT